MKNKHYFLILKFLLFFTIFQILITSQSLAFFNNRLSVQGFLKDNIGPINDVAGFPMQFTIKKNGSAVWCQTSGSNIPVNNGVFMTNLSGISNCATLTNTLDASVLNHSADSDLFVVDIIVDVSKNGFGGGDDVTFSGISLTPAPFSMIANFATSAGNVSGTVAIANGGTGATTAVGARTNLGLGSIATINLSGNASEYLKGDGTWATIGGGGGTVTNVSGTAPISVINGTTTPNISISQANTSTSGYLSSTDWNTFNNKLGSVAGSALTSANIWIGNGSNLATAVSVSGDISLSNTGVTTIQTNAINSTKILDGSIAPADLNFQGVMAVNTGVVIRDDSGNFHNKNCAANQLIAWSVVNGWSCAGIDDLLPNTTKGDLIVHNGTSNVRQAVGANEQILVSDSAQANGVKWTTNIGTVFSTNLGAGTLGAGSTRYISPTINSNNATEANRQIVMPVAGVIRDLYVRTSGTQSATGALTFRVRKNGVNTAIVVTIPAGGAANTYSDVTNTDTVAAGDLISISGVNSASATSTGIRAVSLRLVPQ